MKQTPTPISKLPWSHFQNEIRNCDGHGVAECSSEERAKQIVRAVNSHEELMEAAKNLLKVMDGGYGDEIISRHPITDHPLNAHGAAKLLLEKAIQRAERKE